MTVASSVKLQVDAIPSEGAVSFLNQVFFFFFFLIYEKKIQGMFKKVLHGEWIIGYSAMGCPSFGNYAKNPRYLLEIRELTTVK